MVKSLISINGGTAGVSDVTLTLGVSVSLSNDDDTDINEWYWEFIDKPSGSSATLSTPTSSTSSFTPDVTGSYLIQLTVNDRIKSRIIAAVKTTVGLRIPARYESQEAGGWQSAYADNFNVIESSLGGASVHSIGGVFHSTDTLANLNSKITDATLDDQSDSRSPSGSAGGQLDGTYPNPSVVGVTAENGTGDALTTGIISSGQILKRYTTSIIGVYIDTPLPILSWVGNNSVSVTPKPNQHSTSTIITFQDGKQRSFSGSLSFQPSTGDNEGGLDTGSEASDTWYYLYLVPKQADNTLLTIRGSTT